MNVFNVANATTDDYADIYQFFTKTRVKFFGEYQIKYVTPEVYFNRYVTHRLLVRLSNKNGMIVGYAEFSNAPNIPALAEDCWMDWIKYHYCTGLPLSAVNTYFFNTFVFHPDYAPDMIPQLIEEFYFREHKLRYIITVQCPEYGLTFGEEAPMYSVLETCSHTYYPKCFSAISCPNTQCLYIMFRDDIVSSMRHRYALPEDNDDIVRIVHGDRPELRQVLGDYYIAEELLIPNTKSIFVITEIGNIPAGFVWLNDNVDILPLLKNYHLDTFGNLIKFNPRKRFREKNLYISVLNKNPGELLFTKEAVRKIYKRLDSSSSTNVMARKVDNVDYIRFLRRCRALNESLSNTTYYYKVQHLNRAFRYNVRAYPENYPYDTHRNVFAIQLFGLIAQHDLRRIFTFLNIAYTVFPDRDYCVLSLPMKTRLSPALFEMLKYFMRINPRPGCTNDETLYITHRSAVFGDITVFPFRQLYLTKILDLIVRKKPRHFPIKRSIKVFGSYVASRFSLTTNVREMIDPSSTYEAKYKSRQYVKVVRALLLDILNNTQSEYKCYVLKCGDSTKPEYRSAVVGFAILRPFHWSPLLKKHFFMPKFDFNVNCAHAEIVTLKLHPFYHFQSDLIFRELARHSHYNRFVCFRPSHKKFLYNDLLTYMQPMEPRHIKKFWFCDFEAPPYNISHHSHDESSDDNASGINIADFTLDYADDHYALFTHNLCPSLYYGNTKNIVVIGFTTLSKAFLRLILFGWHQSSKKLTTNNFLPYVNITVISETGVVEAEYDTKFQCEFCVNTDDCYVNFNNNCAFIRDVTQRLDLRVWVRFVSGDVASISTSKQLINLTSGCTVYYECLLLMCETEFGMPQIIEELPQTPANYIEINNRLDKITFYHKLCCLQSLELANTKHSIIVYGNHIRAFEFIDFLLKHGVPPDEITMVLSSPKLNTQFYLTYNCCEYDASVEEVLQEIIEDCGVKLYKRAILKRVQCHNATRAIKYVTLEVQATNELVTIRCDFFVSFEIRHLRKKMAHVLERAGVRVRNYQILVDESYKTSAHNVYALGKYIKHIQEPNHQYIYVSPAEAATKLIVFMKWNNEPIEIEDKYFRPAYFRAQFPKNYFMAKVIVPKRYLARHLNNEYGVPMTTYKDCDFCRVRLNTNNIVEEILIVTQKTIDLDFLSYFCGQHELLLNNMKSRWYMEEIDSFLEYFQQPWTELLVNDYFEDLQSYNKRLIMPTAEEVMRMPIPQEQRYTVLENIAHEFGITSRVEDALLLFLREHRRDFHNTFALPEDFPAEFNKDDIL